MIELFNKILIGMVILTTMANANVKIIDEVGLLSKKFIKSQEKSFKDSKKEIVVLIKKGIGDANPAVYGAEYLQENDLGGKCGSGIVILHIIDKRWVQVVTGYKIEEKLTDSETDKLITEKILNKFKIGKFEEGYKAGIENSIKILNEVIK